MARLSLCMIVRDAEEGLERCLESAAPFVDEIVIVDTGSKDRTPEIAKRYAHVYTEIPWPDDFSAARNVSLSLATGDWILVMDGDEALYPPTAHLLRPALADARFVAYQLTHSHLLSWSGQCRDVYALRLFRRHPHLRYAWPIHEQISVAANELAQAEGLEVGRIPVVIKHFGYLPGSNPGRSSRNIRLIERTLKEQPDDPYYLYKLAEELRELDPLRSELLLEQASALLLAYPPERLRRHSFALEVLAQTIQRRCHRQGPASALPLADQAIQVLAPTALLFYLRAALHLQLQHAAPAQADLERCVSLSAETQDTYFDAKEVMGQANLKLADLYYQQGYYLRAAPCYEQALSLDPLLEPARVGQLRIRALTGDPGGALRACLDWFKQNRSGEAALLTGELLMGLGQLDAAARWLQSVERDFRNNPGVMQRLPHLRQMLVDFSQGPGTG